MLRILIHLLVSLVLFAGPVLADPPESVLRQVLDQPLAFRTTFDGGVVSSRLSGPGAVTGGSYSGAPTFYAPTIASGNLTVGKVYQITARSTADFTADGAEANTVGTYFVASGTSVTLDATNTVVECSLDAENLITNGGFETAGAGGADVFAGWSEEASDGAIADETIIVHYGSHSTKLTAGASRNTRQYLSGIAVSEGEKYCLSFWQYSDGNSPRFMVYDLSNSQAVTSPSVSASNITDSAWVQSHYIFTAPSGCTSIGVYLYCPYLNTGVAYFDDASLRRILPGAELLSDPDFDDAGAWTAGTGWSVADGMASCDGSQGGAWTSCTHANVTAKDSLYRVDFSAENITAGAVNGGSPNRTLTSDGVTSNTLIETYLGRARGPEARLNFAGDVTYFSIRKIDIASCFATTRLAGAKKVCATTSCFGGEQSGVAMMVDSQANPQNFVVAYIDGSGNNFLAFFKYESGVLTTLFVTSCSYTAGYMLQIKRSGDVFSVWYGPDANSLSQVGTDQTITGMTGNYHGLIYTGDQSTFGELRMQ